MSASYAVTPIVLGPWLTRTLVMWAPTSGNVAMSACADGTRTAAGDQGGRGDGGGAAEDAGHRVTP